MGSDVRDLDGNDPVTVLTTNELAGLVNGNGEEPRPQLGRVAERSELGPGDGPRGLRRVLREVRIAGDHLAQPGHVVVVSPDDPCEGHGVARGCGLDDRGRDRAPG